MNISVHLITKLLKPRYLFFYFIMPVIFVNLIIIIPYASYSHNRIITYQTAQDISPHEIFSFQSTLPRNLNLSESSVLETQYKIKNISLGLIYESTVLINDIQSDIFVAYIPDDFLFSKQVWNINESIDSLISYTLSENLFITPDYDNLENLKIEGNNITIYYNSSLIIEESAAFGTDLMTLLRRNLDYYTTNPGGKIPLLVLPLDKNESFNLTLSPFQIVGDVFHFIYYDYSSIFFEEHGSFRIKGELIKLQAQIENYLENLYSITLERLEVNTQFFDYINLNSGYSFLSDLLIPTLIFIHGFAIGLVIIFQFLERLFLKVNTFVKLLLERGGTKMQAAKSILLTMFLTITISFILTLLASFLVINIGILSYYNVKMSFLNVTLVALISTILISLISMGRISNYVLQFEIDKTSTHVEKNKKSRKRKFLLLFALTITDVLVLSLLGFALINDFETHIMANPLYIISIVLIFLSVWYSFISDFLYKLFRFMVRKVVSRKKMGIVQNKLLSSISLKYIRTFKVFVLLFFIIIIIFQTMSSVQTRQISEVQFSNIGDLNIKFDYNYAQIYHKNFRTIVSDDVIFFEMNAYIGIHDSKSRVTYFYPFPIFIFSSTNFSEYLSLSDIETCKINFNLTEEETQFFISKKLVDLKEKEVDDSLIFDLQGQIESFQITGILDTMPVLSLVSHQSDTREIRDAYAILVYDNNEENQFKDFLDSIISISVFDDENSSQIFTEKLSYFNSLGINFNLLDSTTLDTNIILNQSIIQSSSFFFLETLSRYGFAEIIVLCLSCIYLLSFSIFSFYIQLFRSSFVLISRGLSPKRIINFGLTVTILLVLFYFLISYLLATLMTGLFCIFISTKYYIKFYPVLNSNSIVGIFSFIILIIFILVVTRLVFKRGVEKNLSNLLKQTKNTAREGWVSYEEE